MVESRTPPSEPNRSKVDRIAATGALIDFVHGNPNITLVAVKGLYKTATQAAFEEGEYPWMQNQFDIAKCAVLGINPMTGEDVPDPDELVVTLSKKDPLVGSAYNYWKDLVTTQEALRGISPTSSDSA